MKCLCGRVDVMVAELDAGNYTVPLTAGFQRCRAQLPWWRGVASSDHPKASAEALAALASAEVSAAIA